MPAAATDKFMKVGMSTATTLSAPGYTIGNTSITVGSTTNWPTDTGVTFAIDTVTVVNGVEVQDAGSYNEYVGTVATGTTITNVAWADGDGNKNYSAGSTTRVYIPVSKTRENRLVDGILAEHKQTGAHGTVTADSITVTGNVTAANFIQSGGADAAGWTVGLATPNTVTCNGNRSYDLVFNGTDLTGTLSPGMRLRTTRTVAAPTQCTSLNGTTQYYSKSSPTGMTFTDDFVVSVWVKLTSYANVVIASRYNGTSGWGLYIGSTGQVHLVGYNAGAANYSEVVSYQSVPLNKWVHISAQLDMSTFTASTTTSYVMIDGVDVPSSVGRGGTNPTALVQAGNLEIGSWNAGTLPFPGKIAQVAVFNAKVTQATMQGYISQGLSGSETSLISAYSFNNSINDLNTTNANNLTANGSAVATNADSPFGTQASGSISSTLDYGIIQSATFSTNTTVTVQVPEGCTIPTSGGVSAVSYSTQKAPYGFPIQTSKWEISYICNIDVTSASLSTNVWGVMPNSTLYIQIGSWSYGYRGFLQENGGGSSSSFAHVCLATATPANTTYSNRTVAGIYDAGAQYTGGHVTGNDQVNLSAATAYNLYTIYSQGTATVTNGMRGSLEPTVIYAENAYL